MVTPAERLSTYTRCKSCGSLQLWCLTVGGKRIPLEVKPHPAGTVVVTHLPTGEVRGQVLTGEQLPAMVEAYRPHERVCPGSERAAALPAGPRCGACRGLLDDWLVQRGYTRHIGCLSVPAPVKDWLTARSAPAEPPPADAPVHEQGDLFDTPDGAA